MFTPTQARAAGFYDPNEASADTALHCRDASLTIQSQTNDTDINVLVERFGLTGELAVTNRVPFPGPVDIDEVLDFRLAMERQRQASESFLSLPASVRNLFQNDMISFCEYAENPAHLEQLRLWGLAKPLEAPAAAAATSPA